ncbi:MAG: tetratricopeptide repeat protein [Rubrivivax sp.]|nr:tetratricopeptide repeat protein [Rubrivivax sp.]
MGRALSAAGAILALGEQWHARQSRFLPRYLFAESAVMAITRINLSLGFLVAALALGCGGKSEGDLIASAKQFMAKAEYSAAAVDLKLALQQARSSAEARFLLGVVLLEQGNNSAAMVELGKARDQNFNEELLAPKLARGWLATGKFKEIAQAYDGTTLKIASSQAELSTAVALAHARLNQRAKAGAAIAEALKADPKYPWALVTKARLVAGSGKVDEALALVNQAITPGSPSGDAFFMRGELLRAGKNDLDGAIKAYQQASADPKVELAARTALIQIYLSRRRLAEARAQLAELQKSFPKNPQSHYLDALVAYAGKDYARAESVTEQLLRVAPKSPQLLVLGGAASLQQGALLAAESKLGKVVQTVEGSTVARKILAETYLRMGQPEKRSPRCAPYSNGRSRTVKLWR